MPICKVCKGDSDLGHPTEGYIDMRFGKEALGIHCDVCSVIVMATIALLNAETSQKEAVDGFLRFLKSRQQVKALAAADIGEAV